MCACARHVLLAQTTDSAAGLLSELTGGMLYTVCQLSDRPKLYTNRWVDLSRAVMVPSVFVEVVNAASYIPVCAWLRNLDGACWCCWYCMIVRDGLSSWPGLILITTVACGP